MKKPQLPLIIAGVLLLIVLAAGGVFAYNKFFKKTAEQTQTQAPKKKKITEPVNVIPVAERPYIQIVPQDIHNVVIQVNELKKPATGVDYELEYQTESNLEGAVGTLDLASVPAKKVILLGSCSAGGACRYHQNVKGGTLLAKFSGSENYVVKSDWKYIENPKKETMFSSKDAKFQIDSKDLGAQRILVIYNSPGYPKTPTGTVISDVYTVTAMNDLKGKGNLSIRANEDVSSASIMGWDGQSWKEFKGKADGKTVTAEVDLLQVYVVVKK
jgi:hypothetical protein